MINLLLKTVAPLFKPATQVGAALLTLASKLLNAASFKMIGLARNNLVEVDMGRQREG